MRQIWEIHRFIERDYWYRRIRENSRYLSEQQIQRIVEGLPGPMRDMTFKFFSDGSVLITDNETGRAVRPRDLTGPCLDFYVRKRIAYIKDRLRQASEQPA